MSTTARVRLQTLGGRTSDLEIALDGMVSDLKKHVADTWQVKPSHQKLVVGADVLLDFDSIDSIVGRSACPESEPLVVMVICGEQPLPNERSAALSTLIERMDSQDSQVRRAAIASLSRAIDVAQHREVEWFVEKVATHTLAAASVSTRRSGLEALAQTSPVGHDMSIRAASRCLEDKSDFVRLTAVETVTKLALRGDENTVTAMKLLSKKRSESVKVAALLVLGNVAHETSKGVMDIFEKCSDHECAEVRNAASEGVASLLRSH